MLQSLIFWQAFSGIDMNQIPFDSLFYSLLAAVSQLLPSHHLLLKLQEKMCHEDPVVKCGTSPGTKAWIIWVWHVGRATSTLVVLAQSVGTIYLVIRRFTVIEEAWLLLDVWNCYVVISGAIAATISLIIIIFKSEDQWTHPGACAIHDTKFRVGSSFEGLGPEMQMPCCYVVLQLGIPSTRWILGSDTANA